MSEIPNSIKSALVKPLERVYLLYLEKELISFIKDSLVDYAKNIDNEQDPVKDHKHPKPQYTIKANYLKNSYYRLLSHQLCHYYNLQHWNNTLNEILVTPTDSFNYKQFMATIESRAENEIIFKKLCDIVSDDSSLNGNEVGSNLPPPKPITTISAPTAVKPKLIMKKNKSFKSSSDDNSDTSQHQDTMDSKIGSPIPDDSSVTSTPTEVSESFKIESERASKEALYLKVREQIFDEADDDAQEEDEDDDEEDEQSDEFINQDHRYNNSHQRYNQINPPKFIPYMNPSNIPMHMPIAYGNGMSPPAFIQPNGYFPPSPGAVPMVYPANFFNPNNSIMPPAPGYYGFNPSQMGVAPPPPPNPPYDKETERRLLNNPYIIIPGDNNHRSQYKPRQNSGQGKNNGYNNHNNHYNGNGKYYNNSNNSNNSSSHSNSNSNGNGNSNGSSGSGTSNGYHNGGGQYQANSQGNYSHSESNGTKHRHVSPKTAVPNKIHTINQ